MIYKRFCNKMVPNSDLEEDLYRTKSAYFLVIATGLLATLAWTISTTPKKTSQAVANGDQYEREPAFALPDKPIGHLNIKGSDKVNRLMLNINSDFTFTFGISMNNDQFTAFAGHLFKLHSGDLSETLAA